MVSIRKDIILIIISIIAFAISLTLGFNIVIQIFYDITQWFVFSPVFCDGACIVLICLIIIFALILLPLFAINNNKKDGAFISLFIFLIAIVLIIFLIGVIISREMAHVILLVIKAWLRSINV